MSDSQFLAGKVIKRSLPVLDTAGKPDAPNLKRLFLAQGELAQIHNAGEPVQYVAVVELREGCVRGNHFHKVKRESVYLITGELVLLLEDLETSGCERIVMAAGDLVFIPPGIAHALRTVRPGWAIEFAPEPLDPTDSFRHLLQDA